MDLQATFNRAFAAWEAKTADALDRLLRRAGVLSALGAGLSLSARWRSAAADALRTAWSLLGLPNKRDQERILHALNELHSRVNDLEDHLRDARAGPAAHAGPPLRAPARPRRVRGTP